MAVHPATSAVDYGAFQMRISTPSRLMTMSRTDKETRLKDFIAESLMVLAEGTDVPGAVTMIARNAESPAARALYAALLETASTADVRLIIADARMEQASPSISRYLRNSNAAFSLIHASVLLTSSSLSAARTSGLATACAAIPTNAMPSSFITRPIWLPASARRFRSKDYGHAQRRWFLQKIPKSRRKSLPRDSRTPSTAISGPTVNKSPLQFTR